MKIAYLAAVIGVVVLFTGCAHKSSVSTVRATNIYSDNDKKIPGKFVYSVNSTSLTKLKVEDSVKGMQCSAHHFPVDGTDAFEQSFPHMLDQVFDNIQKSDSPTGDPQTTRLVFSVERFEPRLRFNAKFWGADADATVELGVSVVGTKNSARVFGTTVDTQRSKSGDGGSFCSGGGEVLADATRDAIKDVLEKLGERMANSQALRAAGASSVVPAKK